MSAETYSSRLRDEFVRLLTVDSGADRRRKDFNRAIFMVGGTFHGEAVYTNTNLDMVMEKFDKAVRNLEAADVR